MQMEKTRTPDDYLLILWNRRRFIAAVFVFAEIFTLIFSLLAPKTYKSTAAALPPEVEGTVVGSLSSRRFGYGLGGGIGQGLFSSGSQTDMIMAMLKSRRMAEDVVKKFDLQKFYQKKYLTDAVKRLKTDTAVSLSRENVISVSVELTDRNLAAEIANFYLTNLNDMNNELELTASKPIVRLLDVAGPAERKSKPSIRLNLLLAGMLAIAVAFTLAYLFEYGPGYLDRLKKSLPVSSTGKRVGF